jgi:drug/metabolite transporter (DMT)-like permease
MNIGYLFLFTAMVAFGALGIFHKVADHPHCRPKMTALLLNFWGGIITIVFAATAVPGGLHFTSRVLLIGSGTGIISALTLFVFQTALKHGKISTSWLIINLTTAVPVVLSVYLFNEKISSAKALGVVLVFIAIVMLWLDRRRDLKKIDAENPHSGIAEKSKWLPLMMLTFIGQGLASTGSKLLVEAKAGDYVLQFLIVLYWTGFITLLLLSIMREAWPNRRELLTTLVMAVCSVVGNGAITVALKTVKGSIAYPVNNGSLIIVVLAGVLIFREKIHPIGIAGIVCGIGAVLILVLN